MYKEFVLLLLKYFSKLRVLLLHFEYIWQQGDKAGIYQKKMCNVLDDCIFVHICE